MTHSRYLPLICKDVPIKLNIYRRFNQFLHSIVNSDNSIVRLCANILLMGSKSNVGENIKTTSNELNCLREEVCMPPGLFNRNIMNTLEAMCSEEDVVVVDNILDLLYITDKNWIQFSKNKLIVCLPFYV